MLAVPAGSVCSPRKCEHNRSARIRARILSAATLISLACVVPLAHSQQSKAGEFQVKAAYLYNFGRFVAWPDQNSPDANAAFEICVLGADPFGATLDSTLATASIGGKNVQAKRITKPQDVDDCRILFISTSEERHLKDVLSALDNASVLTVSDIPRFSERGGMIGFILDGDRVRFDVNLSSAQSARLTLSSELLKVATNVRKDSHPEAFR